MAVEEVGIRLSLKERRTVAAGLAATERELEDVADAGYRVEDAGTAAARGLEKASDRRFSRGFRAIGRGALGVTRVVGRGLLSAARVGAYGLGLAAAAAGALSVKAIGLAGDARETASAFDTVFGPSARRVQGDLDRLTKRFGVYNPELQDATRQFGVFGKAAGMAQADLGAFSTDLVKAGLDLASFYNADPGEVFGALQSGLAGETEPLRRFGIFLSQTAVEAQAASMGLTGELTEQQKVMVRQAIIMKSLGDAQGDLARTSEGYANQQRAATGRTRTFLSMLGGPLTTAATGAWRGLNHILRGAIRELRGELPGLEKDARGASRTFEGWGRSIARRIPNAIDTVRTKLDDMRGAWDRLTSGDTGVQLGALTGNVKELGAALPELGEHLPGVADLLAVINTVTGFLAEHTDELSMAMPYLVAGYVALKVSQMAANLVLAASLPMKIAEFAVNRQLVKSNKELIASRAGVTAATTVQTGATAASTAATGGATVATRALGFAMRALPIFAIISAIALIASGLVYAYKKSETFRAIVHGAMSAVKTAVGWVKDAFWAVVDAIKGAIGWVGDMAGKVKGALGFVKGLIDRTEYASNLGEGLSGAFSNAASDIEDMFQPGPRGRGAGRRAFGGPVTRGRPYVVGERRPELFVPRVDGRILPRIPDPEHWDDDVDVTVGRRDGTDGPLVVRLEVDGKVLAETVVDEFDKKGARK